MGKSVSGIGRGLPLLRENLCVVAAMATDEFLPKLLRRNVPPQLTLDHVSPATRLLEKRRQKIEVQEALEAHKADESREKAHRRGEEENRIHTADRKAQGA